MIIKGILLNQDLSYYDLGRILEEVGKVLVELPNSVLRNVEASEQDAINRIESIIKSVNNRLVMLEKNIQQSEQELIDAADTHYNKTRDTIDRLNKRLSALPAIVSVDMPTHRMKELLEIAERIEYLSDKQFERLIELAKALGEREP